MKKRQAIVWAAALLWSGCIPSVNPFYTQKDVLFEAGLLGEWQEQTSDRPETWTFARAGDQAYTLTIVDKEGRQGVFQGRLFRLNREYFLDLVPGDCQYATRQAELVACAMFPGHLLLRVPQLGPELRLASVDYDWLQKQLEAHPNSLAHHREGDRIVLTADTRALQRFVMKHLGEGELFEKPGVMVRKPGGANP